jgi:NAD(P)H-dependent FMN reductase
MSADVCIMVGSIRKDSHSLRVAGMLAGLLKKSGKAAEVIDPRSLRFVVPHHPDDDGGSSELAAKLQAQVQAAEKIIFITPEYDGSYSAVSKILIEHLGYPSVLAGKPVSVIGVATGRIGAYRAIEHLRGVLLHIGAYVCPALLSLAEVHKSAAAEETADLEQKLSRHLNELLAFRIA